MLGCCLTVFVVTACTAKATNVRVTSSSRTQIQPSQPVSPTGEQGTSAGVRALVSTFVSSFNAGDQRTLEQLWAQAGSGWEWFSTDGPEARFNAVARDRAGLAAFFSRRHAKHETLRLTSFQFNGTIDRGDFEYTLVRAADDMKSASYTGKGFALCTSPPITLGVWSMARDPRK